MRLADFITSNVEPILREWEEFARTCTPASGAMDIADLRDHAAEMLKVIAVDLATPQNRSEQTEKSKGNAKADDPSLTTAAEEHGEDRAQSGFALDQMVAEYRALRASVVRLWTKEQVQLTTADIEDLTRFNEAIDQALAESVARYSGALEQSKEMFLAMLGHDLRTPLGAIATSAEFVLETVEMNDSSRKLVERINSSANRTMRMVGDLLDFTRSRLGGSIPISPTQTNLDTLLRDVVHEVSVSRPGSQVRVTVPADLHGQWDAPRITQALTNLVTNAVVHGADPKSVDVSATAQDDQAVITIKNPGVIPPERMNGIFNPMKARHAPLKLASNEPTGSLGLGLYIAEQIISAHHGRISVESSEELGTTFVVSLPRLADVDHAAQHR
jgi:signal transduction histidine kinase